MQTASHPEVQPRMAAWLFSLGCEVSPLAASAALREFGSWTFMAFISQCRAIALRLHVGAANDRITNQNDFTEVCWSEARHRRLGATIGNLKTA